jgi:hypothetical protein
MWQKQMISHLPTGEFSKVVRLSDLFKLRIKEAWDAGKLSAKTR